MVLPSSAASRQAMHRRSVDVSVFRRDDRLWEVDAILRDVKTYDTQLSVGIRPAGTPIHDMTLRLVIDEAMNVLHAGSISSWVPYPGHCDEHGEAYAALVGLNLQRGFRKAVAERVGGVRGCAHLTELAQLLPTAVIQAFAGVVIDTRGEGDGATQPFQLDRCHALRTDGEVVKLHYPRWQRQPDANNGPDNARAAEVAKAASSDGVTRSVQT